MAIRFKFNNEVFRRQIGKATAAGLQRAGLYFQGRCRAAVSKSNPHHHVAHFNAAQRAARRGQKTGKVYENMHNRYAGTPPFARTGYGRSQIVYEHNGNLLYPRVRVGVTKNAIYMAYLELGTGAIKARPWLLATLRQYRQKLIDLAMSGGR